MDFNKLIRPHFLKINSYGSARLEFGFDADVFLDANENPYNKIKFNRYPDPMQQKLKQKISVLKNVKDSNIFCGNGSDEIIDLLIKLFCCPGVDNIIITPPTYGIYEFYGSSADVGIIKCTLNNDFSLPVEKILSCVTKNSKILFLNNPNNPTGNVFSNTDMVYLIENFKGIVLVDEAYIDFSKAKSFVPLIKRYKNLVVLQTFSKAYGLAALRVGTAYANEEMIFWLNKIKPPYNISFLSQKLTLLALEKEEEKNERIRKIIEQRHFLTKELKKFSFISKVFQSQTNYILVKTIDAAKLYNFLIKNKIVVRNRSKEPLCDNCLRITIGTEKENIKLLKALSCYK